ncbi:MAG TPA: endolytic transglycosylase MltG [Candidatus Hydrogenedentes bacterium]|nr:endolytic transglycosylase MltG [Candidatus Hydrogenedentota bacterium]
MNSDPSQDAPRERPRRERFCLRIVLKCCLYLVALLLLIGTVGAVLALLAYRHVTEPGTAGEPIRVTIPEGITATEVGTILAENGLIEHELFFRMALKIDGAHEPIRHGKYDLPIGLSPLELLERLYAGPTLESFVDQFKVTIPEGLTVTQMARLFDTPEAFVEAAADPGLINRLGIDALTLEGFLMPNTYFFPEQPTEREVVQRMVEQFERTYAALLDAIPEAAGRSKMEIVTVASLIEEEARTDEERPLIAAVIYNRLEKNILLQMDSTLQFALGKYGQRLVNDDKEIDSPYNTYKRPGLPPGPISNPGEASLRAAMKPSNDKYLYFVSNADGKTHTFSVTAREHEQAVARFRRAIRQQRKALEEKRE